MQKETYSALASLDSFKGFIHNKLSLITVRYSHVVSDTSGNMTESITKLPGLMKR